MSIRNNVLLIGHLGNQPEVKTSNDTKYTHFDIATSEKYRVGEEVQEKTTWHKCTAFGSAAETIAKSLKKGSKLALNGSLDYSTYTDAEGVKRRTADIKVHSFEIL